MTADQFIAKWQAADLKERAACQEHFLDLCHVLGQPTPAAADPTGDWFTFEKGLTKDGGGQGFADVWRRGFFGWEYKGKKKDLKAAYQQLSQYREALGNPPLLVVCDLDRFEVHTNFTGTVKEVHAFDLAGLHDPANLQVLRWAFTDPDRLRPGRTQKQVTEDIAGRFARLADGLHARGVEPVTAGHFLMKLMFCMFAEDIELLPEGLFLDTVEAAKGNQAELTEVLAELFARMNGGGRFGREKLPRFNGHLFADGDVVPLTRSEIAELIDCAKCDWSQVEPSIFGTLFERLLDPAKRSQLGAHYTSREDIDTLLLPVLVAPLRREWDATRAAADTLWAKAAKGKPGSKPRLAFENAVGTFLKRLADTTVLDPACGSGNFLYVALFHLLDLEKEVLTYLAGKDQRQRFPGVRPTQLRGIERNPFARELAQVVIWIGFLQWMRFNGFVAPSDPVLDPMDSIECRDAVLDLTDPAHPREPDWPAAEFVVGNPPFLGTKKLRGELGDDYTLKLFKLYGDRIPNFSDLCCYWFEKARASIAGARSKRAGLIATQGIRGGENRTVLERIRETGGIFFAVSDQDWVLDGANVHISMVGFDDGTDTSRVLDGTPVGVINPNLTAAADTTLATKLVANRGIGFVGDVKSGSFDIPLADAVSMLHEPNPHLRPNSDVIVPWVNGLDVTRRPRDFWIIDFGDAMSLDDAELYERPIAHVRKQVKPLRDQVKRAAYRDYWWVHAEPCEVMRRKLDPLDRYLVTTVVSKHRLFAWLAAPILPDHQLIAFG